MLQIADNIREVSGVDARALPDELLASTEPVVIRGLVAHWPMVAAARESAAAAMRYLLGFYSDATVGAMLGAPDIEGRFFYNDDLSGFNFRPVKIRLDDVLAEIADRLDDTRPPALYVG